MKRIVCIILTSLAAIFTVGCNKDDGGDSRRVDTYTVAVVVPLSGGTESQWRSTVDWAVSNMDKAQLSCRHAVKLNVEMYDETVEDIASLGKTLADREDVMAVIGPVNQDRLNTMGSCINNSGKPLFAISAGATDVVRRYASKGNFFWALTQTDVSECEAILATAAQKGHQHFTLICSDGSLSSETFKDWFPYECAEMNLELEGNYIYSSSSEIADLMRKPVEDGHGKEDAIICVPKDEPEARIMLQTASEIMSTLPDDNQPVIYFSSDVVQMPVKDLDLGFNFWSVYPFSDPQSGFNSAYYAHTKNTSYTFEAQLYDALMLCAFALAWNADDIKQGLLDVTGVDGSDLRAWSKEGMQQVFAELESGTLSHHITGASSDLTFDVSNHTCIVNSTFMLSYYWESAFYPISYYSTQHSDQASGAQSDWNWKKDVTDSLYTSPFIYSYPRPDEKWAVVIAASNGFENYRHQADALNMYQFLKSEGFDDEHILLIIADDIANAGENTRPGVVSVTPDGENLYHDLQIDCRQGDLSAKDVLDRIKAMPTDACDNIFVFWSGHGDTDGLIWGEQGVITEDMMRTFFQEMKKGARFRKMMWVVEACYSGVVGQAIDGTYGAIALTAANANETSKAFNYNSEMNIWMSNRFSYDFIETLKQDQGIAIREMYYILAANTLGSHAQIYNYNCYGDVTRMGFREYFP